MKFTKTNLIIILVIAIVIVTAAILTRNAQNSSTSNTPSKTTASYPTTDLKIKNPVQTNTPPPPPPPTTNTDNNVTPPSSTQIYTNDQYGVTLKLMGGVSISYETDPDTLLHAVWKKQGELSEPGYPGGSDAIGYQLSVQVYDKSKVTSDCVTDKSNKTNLVSSKSRTLGALSAIEMDATISEGELPSNEYTFCAESANAKYVVTLYTYDTADYNLVSSTLKFTKNY